MASRRSTHSDHPSTRDEIDPLTPAQEREIERRIKDLDDPRRYVIKSALFPGPPRRWELFYDVTSDCWINDIAGATLFKRRKAALIIARTLGGRFVIEEVKLGRGVRIVRPRASIKRSAASSADRRERR